MLPTLNPDFYFSDKEIFQIHAKQRLYHEDASLCLWYCRRATEKKNSKVSKKVYKQDVISEFLLLGFFDMHYFRSVLLNGGCSESLRHLALQKLTEFFCSGEEKNLLNYLAENWYAANLSPL